MFRFIFLETIQKILGSVDCFLAISLFLSLTRFLWVMTGCFWSSNNLFFCSTEILDVLVGNKFSSFCLSRKLRESNRNNLKPFKVFATMVMSLLFVLHYVTSVFFFFLSKKTLNNLSYNSKQLNKLILFELYKIIKLDFLFKNLLLTYFLSKISIKHSINQYS